MIKVFLIHGAYGNPEENWFPWLKRELEIQGIKVTIPRFPTPANQTLSIWRKALSKYEKDLDKETIFVAHSLGPSFVLDILERSEIKIKASFFVSGFVGLLGNPKFDEINKTFVDKDFDWQKIRKTCSSFFLFHSNNDPYIPLEKAKQLSTNLDAKLKIIRNAGHFNESSGYKTFPLLLKEIENFIQQQPESSLSLIPHCEGLSGNTSLPCLLQPIYLQPLRWKKSLVWISCSVGHARGVLRLA